MSGAEDGPHVLYVAWGFPPSRGGGVYRALATANAFAEDGWAVTVLTASRETFERYTGADASLEDHIHPDIKTIRVPFSWPLLETDVRKFSRARAYAPRLWQRWRTSLDRLPFPEVVYGPWRSTLERAALGIHSQHPVDLVVATANPHVDFTAAWRLHKKGIAYVMDHRDTWLLDMYTGKRVHSRRSRAAHWERRLVRNAREVWFVNRQIRDWHAAVYPNDAMRFHVVSNGYDPNLAPSVSSRRPEAGDELTFGYIGTITAKMPMAEFVAGWRRAREISQRVSRAHVALHGYLGYYRSPRADIRAVLDAAVDDGIHYLGPLAKTDVPAAYGRFDGLLLILGASPFITSGKVFEYMATGLPIVSIHDGDNAASDLLADYPLWFKVQSLRPEAIADALVAAADAALRADAGLREKCVAVAERYRRDNVLRPRIASLRESGRPTPI